jgi:hypothetical protein
MSDTSNSSVYFWSNSVDLFLITESPHAEILFFNLIYLHSYAVVKVTEVAVT